MKAVDAIADSLFESLARAFPVSCASDEFFYFPQVQLAEREWSTWDRFSPETVTEFVRRLLSWEDELDGLYSPELNRDTRIDIHLLRKVARTLREQLSEVRAWESQPTIYLTLVCVGLVEAMESKDPGAKRERAKSLPAFLDQAGRNLKRVPLAFRDIGLEMVSDTRQYLASLLPALPELHLALPALDRFEDAIRKGSTRDDFLLPKDLLKRVFRVHINTGMDIEETERWLDREIGEMCGILNGEAGKILSGERSGESSRGHWAEVLESIPIPDLEKEGLVGLYSREVDNLARHCLEKGIASPSLVTSCPVRVAPQPSYLSAIRTASSYSIKPEHPPTGGMFYIFHSHESDAARQGYHREYRMLAAHETYPGHHLLDTSRWNLARPLRRVVEQPLFYEGWACFAEDLMRRTGYFSTPGDRLLLARRRLWRAIRGKVDIGLQSGAMDLETAARHLAETGISREQACASARKYPLNPGYQVCYTIGLRQFLRLFDGYGRNHLQDFVQPVLEQGEIDFLDLEEILNTSRG